MAVTKPLTFMKKPASWSFSRLKDFETCRAMYKLKHLDKVPEPERPLPPGKTEQANDRGTRVHTSAENYINGTGPFAKEMEKFRPEFEHMRHLFGQGQIIMEHEWAHDQDWEIAEWKSGWLRLKLDAMVRVSDTEAVVIDFKTGRKFGNEVSHMQQIQLYALITFLRYPELEVVHTELFYLDADDITSATFTRSQALRFKRSFNARGLAVTECTSWPANPNVFSCKWCGYGPWGTNDCSKGVRAK